MAKRARQLYEARMSNKENKPQREALNQMRSVLPDCAEDFLLKHLKDHGNDADEAILAILEKSSPPRRKQSGDPVLDLSDSPQLESVDVLQQVRTVLPDADEAFLKEALDAAGGCPDQALQTILESGSSYPRRKATCQAASSSSSSSSSTPFSSTDATPAPPKVDYFDPNWKPSHKTTSKYAEDAVQLLLNEFTEILKKSVLQVFDQNNQAYAQTWKALHLAVSKLVRGEELAPPLVACKMPRKKTQLKRSSNKLLREEVEFVRVWGMRQARAAEDAARRAEYREKCVASGLALECECCFNEELPEDSGQCGAGHIICKGCITRYVETRISGEGNMLTLGCPSMGCSETLPPSELRRILPPQTFDAYDKRLEKVNIELARLNSSDNLEQCPFCDFVMEMDLPKEENKIFVCLSESCGKESCRLCGEESHIPLRCDEVEKKSTQNLRTSVEERMTSALVRECPKCLEKGITTRFLKENGCNKMTCPKCKWWVCYVCKEAIPKKLGYGHFCQCPLDPGKTCKKCTKCPLWESNRFQDEEARRVASAALEADSEFRQQKGHEGKEIEELELVRECRQGLKRKAPLSLDLPKKKNGAKRN